MSAKHTAGPWSQGRLLLTERTARWPESERIRCNAAEHLMVFAQFTPRDEGRSRKLVAQCSTEEDARLIAAAPDLLEIAIAMRSFLEDDSKSARRREACLLGLDVAIAKATGDKQCKPSGSD